MNKQTDTETTILYNSHMPIKINLWIDKNSCVWSQYDRNRQKNTAHCYPTDYVVCGHTTLNLRSNLILTAKQSQAW